MEIWGKWWSGIGVEKDVVLGRRGASKEDLFSIAASRVLIQSHKMGSISHNV